MPHIIEVCDLHKSFKTKKDVLPVLKGASFSVQEGTIFALLGSNGAGKTTAVRILSTLLKLDSGSAKICGFCVDKEPHKVRCNISLTGQYAAVDEMLTGRENLHLVASLRRLKNYKDKIEEYLKLFSLSEAADKLVKTYSGGMRRKTDIAMSLLGDPKIIFLDEPTTGLDPQSRIALWDIIETLKKQGKTIFLTTQYLEEAERLADTVAVLDKGIIVASGTIEQLKSALKNASDYEYEKEMPSLEDVFLSIISKKDEGHDGASDEVGMAKKEEDKEGGA